VPLRRRNQLPGFDVSIPRHFCFLFSEFCLLFLRRRKRVVGFAKKIIPQARRKASESGSWKIHFSDIPAPNDPNHINPAGIFLADCFLTDFIQQIYTMVTRAEHIFCLKRRNL